MQYVDQLIPVPGSVAEGASVVVTQKENKWIELPVAGSLLGTVEIRGRRTLKHGKVSDGEWIVILTQVDAPSAASMFEVPEPYDEIQANTTAWTSGTWAPIARGGW